MNDTKMTKKEEASYRDGMVHLMLSHSYTVFLAAVVLGLIIDIFVPINIFDGEKYDQIGFAMIVLASILIYWAQRTSGNKLHKKNGVLDFASGPYKYTRTPTHYGLTIMTLGLALILSSAFSAILTIVAFIITKLIFLKKEEDLLEEKYGEAYTDYKKKVCR